MILYKDCSSHLVLSKTWPPGGGVIFPLYLYRKLKKNLLVRNHWTDFHIILQKCFFIDPLPRLFKSFGFVKKHGRQGTGPIFLIYLYRTIKKSSCQKPLNRFFNIILQKCFLFNPLPRLFKPSRFVKKNMAARGWGLFSLYIYIENFRKLLVRNHRTDFIITWQKCFLGDPQVIVICQKTWLLEGGAYFPYIIYIEN